MTTLKDEASRFSAQMIGQPIDGSLIEKSFQACAVSLPIKSLVDVIAEVRNLTFFWPKDEARERLRLIHEKVSLALDDWYKANE